MVILCGGLWLGAYLSLSTYNKMDWNASFFEQEFPFSILIFVVFAYNCYLMFIMFKASYYTVQFNDRTFTHNFLWDKTYDYADVKDIFMVHMFMKKGGVSDILKIKTNFYTVIRLTLNELDSLDRNYIINSLEFYTRIHYKETEISMWHM